MIGVYGCNNNKEKLKINIETSENDDTHTERKELNTKVNNMKKYLYDKYGYIDYEEVGYLPAGWDQPYDILNLKTEFEGNEESFYVEAHYDGDNVEYKDSYCGLLLRDDFEKLVAEHANPIFPDCKIYADYLSDISYPSDFDMNLGINELINKKSHLQVVIFVIFVDENAIKNEEEFNKKASEFINDWGSVGILSRPRIICIGEENYNNLQRSQIQQYLTDYIYHYSDIVS